MTLFPRTILIEADLEQKQSVTVGGMVFQIVPNRGRYESNARETEPVAAQVVAAGEGVPLEAGDIVVIHHNMIMDEIWKVTDQSVIPYDRWVLATVDSEGHLIPTPDNIIADRVRKPSTVGEYALPETAIEFYNDRVVTEDGHILVIRKWADYEVCYNWNGEVRRKVVLWKEDVVGMIEEDNSPEALAKYMHEHTVVRWGEAFDIAQEQSAKLIKQEGDKTYEEWLKLKGE